MLGIRRHTIADYIAIIRRSVSKESFSRAAVDPTPIFCCQNFEERVFDDRPSQLNKHVRQGLSSESVVKQLKRLLPCDQRQRNLIIKVRGSGGYKLF